MRYEFTEDLFTGNSMIDTEHKKLLKAVDDLMQHISSGHGKDQVDSAVNFLLSYTKEHFKHEEDLQKQNSYPEYEKHLAWHKKYIDTLSGLQQKLVGNGASSLMVVELTGAVSDLVKHIKTFDKKLADYLKSR